MEFLKLYMVLEIHEKMSSQSNKEYIGLSTSGNSESEKTLLTILCSGNVVPWASLLMELSW